ncbi:AUGMIN subunit 7 [Hordeum vulgare]|nr:AUGMIN subunit 7 [Hordeum vulgare]
MASKQMEEIQRKLAVLAYPCASAPAQSLLFAGVERYRLLEWLFFRYVRCGPEAAGRQIALHAAELAGGQPRPRRGEQQFLPTRFAALDWEMLRSRLVLVANADALRSPPLTDETEFSESD